MSVIKMNNNKCWWGCGETVSFKMCSHYLLNFFNSYFTFCPGLLEVTPVSAQLSAKLNGLGRDCA